jgi:hypothetical protein
LLFLITFIIASIIAKPVRYKMCGDEKTPFQQLR